MKNINKVVFFSIIFLLLILSFYTFTTINKNIFKPTNTKCEECPKCQTCTCKTKNTNTDINDTYPVAKIDATKDYVYNAEYEKNVTTESYSTSFNTYYAKDIIVPYLNINSCYTTSLNYEIKNIFDEAIATFNKGVNDQRTFIDQCNYKTYINDNILSIIITYRVGGTDIIHPIYYTYNIDLLTGNKVFYEDAYKLAGYNQDTISSKVNTSISNILNDKLKSFNLSETDKNLYYSRSKEDYQINEKNKTLKYFLSDNKKLNVIVNLKIPAGTEEFDTIIPVEK